MFKPKYKLTPELLKIILETERFYGQLMALRIPKELEINLKRDNLLQSTYISNSIEGNPLTLPEVTNLLLDNRVPVNRDEKEIVNYFSALENLENHLDKSPSISLMKAIHKQVLEGVNNQIAGKVRSERVAVGRYAKEKNTSTFRIKHRPPYHKKEEIENYLKKLFDWTKASDNLSVVLKAGIFHHHFVYLHPFVDGNGRTCRLLTTLIFLKNNYLINKYFVLDDYYDIDRYLYFDKLHSADKGDKTEWLEYFSEGVKYSMQSALSKVKTALEKLSFQKQLTNQEKKVLTIVREMERVTSNYLGQKLKVSRQQAHSLLSSLVEKGFLDKKGSTKSSYYFLK